MFFNADFTAGVVVDLVVLGVFNCKVEDKEVGSMLCCDSLVTFKGV